MTSSFQTVVGTQRDAVPSYGDVDNYEATEADLTDAVNKQITANQEDTVRFYNELQQIQRELAERPLRNLEALAQFSSQAQKAAKAIEERRNTQQLINEAMSFLDKNTKRDLIQKDNSLAAEDAKFDKDLIDETKAGNGDAQNLLYVKNAERPEQISTDQFIADYNSSMVGGRDQIVRDSNGISITDRETFMQLQNSADEILVTGMIRRAEALGIDTNSRKFRRLFYERIYPDMVKRRDASIQSWNRRQEINYEKNRDKQLKETILSTVGSVDFDAEKPLNTEQLITTIINKHGGPTEMSTKQATEYLMKVVYEDIKSDFGSLTDEHLKYLYEDALFAHSGEKGKLTTIKDSNFVQKDSYAALVSKAEGLKIDRDMRQRTLNRNKYQLQIDELIKTETDPSIRDQKLKEILKDAEQDNIYAKDFNLPPDDSSSNGGDARVGVPNVALPIQEDMITATFGSGTPKRYNDLNRNEQLQLFEMEREAAIIIDNQVKGGIEPRAAQATALKRVVDKYKAGGYEKEQVFVDPSVTDIQADNAVFKADQQKVLNQEGFVSSYEQFAIGEYKKHKLYGAENGYPMPQYFEGVVLGTNTRARDYAEARLQATGGANDEGVVTNRPRFKSVGYKTDESGKQILDDEGNPIEEFEIVDEKYDLTQEELNYLDIKPHLGKTLQKLNDPKSFRKILDSFAISGRGLGEYKNQFGFKGRNAESFTVQQVLNIAKRGGSGFGRYGFTYQELKDIVKSGVIDLNATFDENTQSLMAIELVRSRANRTGSTRGALIQAKYGTAQTTEIEDYQEAAWWRLTNLKPDEQRAILAAFPALRKTPNNQFQNLTRGVILAISDEEVAKDKERLRLINRFGLKKDLTFEQVQEKIKERKEKDKKQEEALGAFGSLPG